MNLGDVAPLLRVFHDENAQRFYPEMTNETSAIEWIERNRERYRRDGFGLWAIIDKATGTLIGDCGPTWQDAGGTPVLEIGYHVAPAWRGSRFALEAARTAMAFGFATTTEPLIGSIVAPANSSSASVARLLHRDVRSYVNACGPDRFLFFTKRTQDDAL